MSSIIVQGYDSSRSIITNGFILGGGSAPASNPTSISPDIITQGYGGTFANIILQGYGSAPTSAAPTIKFGGASIGVNSAVAFNGYIRKSSNISVIGVVNTSISQFIKKTSSLNINTSDSVSVNLVPVNQKQGRAVISVGSTVTVQPYKVIYGTISSNPGAGVIINPYKTLSGNIIVNPSLSVRIVAGLPPAQLISHLGLTTYISGNLIVETVLKIYPITLQL